jgi:hypothetical protein
MLYFMVNGSKDININQITDALFEVGNTESRV